MCGCGRPKTSLHATPCGRKVMQSIAGELSFVSFHPRPPRHGRSPQRQQLPVCLRWREWERGGVGASPQGLPWWGRRSCTVTRLPTSQHPAAAEALSQYSAIISAWGSSRNCTHTHVGCNENMSGSGSRLFQSATASSAVPVISQTESQPSHLHT